jgi:hydroxyethylthiazole kinase-like uncharacterized protein yjeF
MIELLSPKQMAEADRLTIEAGISGRGLMEAAGAAVADRAASVVGSEARILVVCGPGNNGGDGFVAARLLAERGFRVGTILIGDRDKLRGDAAWAAAGWQGNVSAGAPEEVRDADLIIDAIYGAGLTRPVDGPAARVIEAMNVSGIPIIAVDLPSGVHGGTGCVTGVAVQAKETVTFFRRKPGHVLLPGRLHCGPVRLAQIGVEEAVLNRIRPNCFLNEPALWLGLLPIPKVQQHKYIRGHTVVVSGPTFTGAARLAARGALRTGSGLVTIASPPAAVLVHSAASTAVMVRSCEGPAGLSQMLDDPRLNTIVIGPGGGVGAVMRDGVEVALRSEAAVVLDADALTSFAETPESLAAMTRGRAAPAVITPHEGEFSRLFKLMPEVLQNGSKLERARAAASALGCIVLLKGPDTVVAAPDGRASIAENAPPWLATAGAGDVLAGMIAGLLAQSMPAFEAASAAVWMHGEAADAFGPGLISEDLPEMLPAVLRGLWHQSGSTSA